MASTPSMSNGSRPGSALGHRVQASVPDDPESHTRPYQDFVKMWDDDRVGRWLAQIGAGQHQDTFKRNDIRGHVLLDVDQAALKEMGVRSVGDRVKITVAIKALRNKCTSSVISLASGSTRSTSPAPSVDGTSTSSGTTLAKRPSGRIPPPLHLSRSNSLATSDSGGMSSSFRTHQTSLSLSNANFSSATTPTSATTPRLVSSASNSPATRGQSQFVHSTSPPRAALPNFKSAPHILTTAASPTNSYTGGINGTSLNQLRNKSASPSPGDRLRSPPGSQLPPRPATTTNSSLAHRKSPSMAAGTRSLSGSPAAYSNEALAAHPYAAASSPTQDAFTVTSYGRASPSTSASTPSTLQSRLLPSPSIPNATTLSPSSSAQSLDDVLRKTSRFVGHDGVSKLIAVADCKDGRDVLARVVKKFSTSASEDELEQWGVFTIGADGSAGRLLNEAELYAICRDSNSPDRQRGLAVRRLPQDKRGRKLQWVFGETGAAIDTSRAGGAGASSNSPASPNYLGIEIPTTFVEPASPLSASPHSADQLPRNNERVKRNRASVVSVMSGLGGADWSSENLSTTHLLDDRDSMYSQRNRNSSTSLVNPSTTSSTGRKLRNFFGQRPPSELIATHLLEYFPRAEKSKLLSKQVRQSLRRSMVRRDSHSSGLTGAGGGGGGQTSWERSSLNEAQSSSRTSEDKGTPQRPTTAGSKSSAPPSILESMFEDDHGEGLDELAAAGEDTRSLASSKFTRYSGGNNKRKSGASRLSLWDKRSKDSDAASIVTVDEVTAELENRRASWAAATNEGSSEDEDAPYRSSSDLSAESVLLDEDDDVEESDDTDDSEEERDQAVGAGQAGKPALKWVRGALIGAGSFGSVFLAMNTSSGSLMAVKQVELPTGNSHNEEKKKAMLEALQREIELLKTLQHENIVQYLDSASDGQHLNIFLEYVPGGSVAALLSNYGAFEEALVSKFVRQILTGLEYLHEREIIHRDIKGANILVDNKGGIKISDFGISKKVEDSSKVHRPSLQGSVYWMAPEVVKQTAYTSKADIWSLGCLVVEMLTGTHPWANLTQMQAIFRIGQSVVPTIPDDISNDAEQFLDETFLIDHDARPSATDLLKHAFVSSTTSGGESDQAGVESSGGSVTAAGVPAGGMANMDVSQQTPTRATFAASATG
ncbi:hypothetical protein ACM66B_005645 [Microbotryomycetes sp. NB124-2]